MCLGPGRSRHLDFINLLCSSQLWWIQMPLWMKQIIFWSAKEKCSVLCLGKLLLGTLLFWPEWPEIVTIVRQVTGATHDWAGPQLARSSLYPSLQAGSALALIHWWTENPTKWHQVIQQKWKISQPWVVFTVRLERNKDTCIFFKIIPDGELETQEGHTDKTRVLCRVASSVKHPQGPQATGGASSLWY